MFPRCPLVRAMSPYPSIDKTSVNVAGVAPSAQTVSRHIHCLREVLSRLNTTFLMTNDLDAILQAVLVGVTAGEGFGFNRAILFRPDSEGKLLEGYKAVGPSSREDAYRIWSEIASRGLSLQEILSESAKAARDSHHYLTQLVRRIRVSLDDRSHPLVRAFEDMNVCVVTDGDRQGWSGEPADLWGGLGLDEFVVVPLHTDVERYGVILADNFVTRRPITQDDVESLQVFAALASIAISKAKSCSHLEERLGSQERLAIALEEKQDLLMETERRALLGRMSDQLLHELRNPLTCIGGVANLLRKKLVDPELKGHAEIIVNEIRRLEGVLSELFAFSSASAVLHREAVALYPLIDACLILLQPELERHGITRHVCMLKKDLVLDLDATLFQQALIHLFKNAIEAMPEGGLLTVSVSQVEDGTVIQITDTGLGIAKGHLHRVDEPFFTTKTQGMGIGLTHAKRVVELHGGHLALVRNRLGGTTVEICLPDGQCPS